MKPQEFAMVMKNIPFTHQTMIIRKQPNLHGICVCTDIQEYAKANNVECVVINLATCDDFFLHELEELIAFRQGKNFVCVFDFTGGCSSRDSKLKEHLLQLLIHREHNGFKIPDNVKIIIYDNILEGNEYERLGFDVALLDKCFACKIEE